ncbi:hypothetical protein A7U60_g1156 [Sanghuangporus baumii]|uniref:Uncharacterized protein n=1 Tax=Sanghuangporus baumii TaxID=108892 RepID=A0A9Q5I4K2_SANBA|nr:hypothetical protein A7U60_g1156 [Sanghuangporus baumii]
MKLLTISVFFLSYSIASFIMIIETEAVQIPGLTDCPSVAVVDSVTINVNGNGIQSTTLKCMDADLSERAATHSRPRNLLSGPSDLLRRNAAECKTPAPECQCGLQFGCSCPQSTSRAPDNGDCLTLIDSLQVISQLVGTTFTVPSQGLELLQFQTCAIEWINQSRDTLEYCWDELGTLASIANQQCLLPAVSTEGACTPVDGLWVMNVIRIDT